MRTQGTLIREGNLQATAKFRRLHAVILLLLLINIVLLVNALVPSVDRLTFIATAKGVIKVAQYDEKKIQSF